MSDREAGRILTVPDTRAAAIAPVRHVLLVYPTVPDGTYWGYDEALHLTGCKSLIPPLGLLCVAAMLPPECETRLVDMNVRRLESADLAWADVVFVSGMIVQKDSLREVVRRAKAAGRPVVAGGPYASSAYPDLPEVDHFIIGEAEGVLDSFWTDFTAGRAKAAYARVTGAQQREELERHFADADLAIMETDYPDLDRTPTPRFELAEMAAYKSMAVQTSRGCPVGCEFCEIGRRFGRNPRYKSAERILAELDRLHALGWNRSIFVVDDNFIGNKRRAKELLVAMAAWQKAHGYPFDFCTEATLTLADDEELLAGMQAAGFDMVFVGIESPATESLKETRKHINTVGDMASRVGKIQAHGIQVTAGFIIGFDNDPADIAERMVQAIQTMGIPTAMVGLLMALPDTDLYDRLAREGRVRIASGGNNTHAFEINFEPRRPAAEVVADYQRVLQTIYEPGLKSYYARCEVLRKAWQPSPHPTRALNRFDIKAFFRFLLAMLAAPYRWQALRFLLRTACTRPSFFPVAISLGIQGHHFRAITKRAFEVQDVSAYLMDRLAAFANLVQSSRPEAMSAERIRILYEEILRDANERYERLSHDTRQALQEQYDSFCMQVDALYARWMGWHGAAETA